MVILYDFQVQKSEYTPGDPSFLGQKYAGFKPVLPLGRGDFIHVNI